MSSVPAKFAAALVFGVAAAATSTTLPVSAAPATDNCLLEPTKDALPQGQHWYYRIERGTGRKCWYTRDADDKAARAETPAPEPAEKPVPRRAEAAPTRSLADAHAEIAPRTRVANEAPAPATAPSVWPSPQAAMSGTAAPAASSQPDTPLTVADATVPDAATTTDDAAAQTLPPPALAAAPVERNTGSLHQLLLVAVGALALAGLTGSAVYRLGRRRKRQDWLRERSNWQSMDNPRDPPWVDPRFAPANSNVPDLDEVKTAKTAQSKTTQPKTAQPEAAQPTTAQPQAEPTQHFESDETGDRVEKIEDFLARLTRQLHEELEGSAAERKARAAS